MRMKIAEAIKAEIAKDPERQKQLESLPPENQEDVVLDIYNKLIKRQMIETHLAENSAKGPSVQLAF